MKIRYEFRVLLPNTEDAFRVAIDIDVRNQEAARNRIKRLYPQAEKINFIRAHRIDRD